MTPSPNQVEDVLKDLAAVLKKHNCLLASPGNTLVLMLGAVEDLGQMRARQLAAFSYITPRSAEYILRGSRIAIRWSDNALGTRELETDGQRSRIEHI
jgi:hypothetical protein